MSFEDFTTFDLQRMSAEELAHKPTDAELTELLTKYFVPPITSAHVERLQGQYYTVRHNGLYSSLSSNYQSIDRYDYTAWMMELVRSRGRGRNFSPSQTEFVLFLAGTLKDFPRPKSYCPARFCGTWREVEGPNVGSTWRLSPQGGMTIEGATKHLDQTTAWCMDARDAPSLGYLEYGWKPDRWLSLYVKAIDDTHMQLEEPMLNKRLQHHLELVSRDHGLPDVWVTV